MPNNFWRGFGYGLFFTALFFWLPGIYTWFVLKAPWWLVLLLAFGILGSMLQMEYRRRAR